MKYLFLLFILLVTVAGCADNVVEIGSDVSTTTGQTSTTTAFFEPIYTTTTTLELSPYTEPVRMDDLACSGTSGNYKCIIVLRDENGKETADYGQLRLAVYEYPEKGFRVVLHEAVYNPTYHDFDNGKKLYYEFPLVVDQFYNKPTQHTLTVSVKFRTDADLFDDAIQIEI